MSRTYKDQPYSIRYKKAIKNVDYLKNLQQVETVLSKYEISVVFKPDEVRAVEDFCNALKEQFEEVEFERREFFGYCFSFADQLEPQYRWPSFMNGCLDSCFLPARAVFRTPVVRPESVPIAMSAARCRSGRSRFSRYPYTFTKPYKLPVHLAFDDDGLCDGIEEEGVELHSKEQLFLVVTARFSVERQYPVYSRGVEYLAYHEAAKIGRGCGCWLCSHPDERRERRERKAHAKLHELCKSLRNGGDFDEVAEVIADAI